MEFEWDAAKDAINRVKHAMPFAEGIKLFADPNAVLLPGRPIQGEQRWIMVGELQGRIFAAVFTWRGETVRVISIRRARTNEQRSYHQGKAPG